MHLKEIRQKTLSGLCFYWSLLSLFGSLTFFLVSSLVPPSDAECDQRNLIFSPLQEAINYRWVNYADYFFPRSVYRTPYNRPIPPDTEQAWRDLVHDFEVSIPEDTLGVLNQSTKHQWKRHPDGGIAANIAVFHHLSCLNTIRLHVVADLDDPWRSEARERVDQCIELLRHKFTCDADVTPFLLQNNPRAIRGDSPDIGTKHKCRNYNDLLSWLRWNVDGR